MTVLEKIRKPVISIPSQSRLFKTQGVPLIKRTILKLVNSFLKPFGAKIIKSEYGSFDMASAVQRICEHDIPIKCILDIGASNGRWSIDTMDVFPDASYLAIEPLHEQKCALERLKKRCDNFDYVLCVAGDTDNQVVMLNVSDDLDGSAVDGTGGEPRKVTVKTIDAIISEKKLVGPFLLKFDTHGYEIPILNGAANTLDNTNIIIMEVYNFEITDHANRFHEMCLHVEKLGFRCYDIADPMPRPYDKAFWQMDMFFCRSNSRIFTSCRYG